MSPLTEMQQAVLGAMSPLNRWCTTDGIATVLEVPAGRVRRTLCILYARGLVTKHAAGWWSRHAAPVTAEECAADPALGRLGG